MKNSNIEAVQQQVNEILEAARKEADNLQSQVDTATRAKEDAAAAFIKAQQAGDPKGYAEAAADQRAYKDIAQMYADKKQAFDAKKLIDKGQYEDMVNQVFQELDEVNARAKEEIEDLLKQISVISSEVTERINTGNKLLHTVQHELFKDPAEMVTANGTRVYHHTLEKRYKDYSLTECVNSMKSNVAYMFSGVK